ncbi:MAG: YaiI/YqxD family protein [Gammaproteobacteria bacterium]|nr:YaiI/YqxD family protein [Gammaproteobacteria bacterium]
MATIWVDADACPRAIRDILYRAAERCQVNVVLVANQSIERPRTRFVQMLQVPHGFDVADNEIVSRVQAGDLVVTADIPLAAEVIERRAEAVNPRGEAYSPDTIRQRLNMRDFMDTMRASGIQTGGPPALSAADRQAFANVLDRYLARLPRP